MAEIHEVEEATNQVNGFPWNLLILYHALLLEACLLFRPNFLLLRLKHVTAWVERGRKEGCGVLVFGWLVALCCLQCVLWGLGFVGWLGFCSFFHSLLHSSESTD